MDSVSKIGQWSWKYAIVKSITRMAFYLFYRKINVYGKKNVPEGGRLIFAANHQNALMDPLAVLMTCKYQPVFLARADIFKKPLVAGILKFFKIMPVYRLKDGVDSMGQNEDTFEKTSKILTDGGCIGIMPEGNHGPPRRLRLLKKGVFRIAFRAEEAVHNTPGIKIIPVGLDYSNIHGVFGELTVNYGEPIEVSKYYDYYSRHPQKGLNAIKKDLTLALKNLIIDINDPVNYEHDKLILEIGSRILRKRIITTSGKTLKKFTVGKAFCQAMYEHFEQNPDNAAEIRSKSSKLREMMEVNGISTDSIDNQGHYFNFISIIRGMICFPVLIAGFLFHIIPYLIIMIVIKKLKDSHFTSSFKFTLGFLLLPLNYVFLAVLFYVHLSTEIMPLIIAAVPLTGILAHFCYRKLRKYLGVLHFRSLCIKNKPVAGLVKDIYFGIIEKLEPVYIKAESRLK